MGNVIQLSREFRPDAARYNATAQLVAAEYLTSLSIYGGGAEKLQYRMGILDREGKLVSLVLKFSLNGNVTQTSLSAHYETNVQSQSKSAQIMSAISRPHEITSIGDHIVFWQKALHELFRTRIEWELWQYHLASPAETGWILANPQLPN